LPGVNVKLAARQCSSKICAGYFGYWYVAIPRASYFKHITVIIGQRRILHADTYVAKKIDFFSFVIYNTLMKQSFVIAVNYAATTQERGEDTSQGLCL
jgi:hypothetical protein